MPTKDPAKRAEHNRTYYAKNKGAHIQRAKIRREECRSLVRDLRKKPCTDCKQQYPWYVMEFDHRDRSDIGGRIGTMANQGSRLKLLAEIEKCDLVCANCHKVRTYRQAVREGRWRDD